MNYKPKLSKAQSIIRKNMEAQKAYIPGGNDPTRPLVKRKFSVQPRNFGDSQAITSLTRITNDADRASKKVPLGLRNLLL